MASTVTDLNNFDLICISGAEAAQFLQGQLSCNLDKLSAAQSLWGACCDIKGRVLSDMQVLQMGADIYLLVQSGMSFSLRKTLDKYIVFSKAKTALVSSSFERYGVYGPHAEKTLTDLFGSAPEQVGQVVHIEHALAYRLPDAVPRFEVLVSLENAALIDQIQDLGVTDDLEEWELADIRQGIVHIHPETQETYTPQLLNYDLNGVIDFKKGCYTGQEIVARMHYRGLAKKRLYRGLVKDLRVSTESLILHKDEIVGEVVSCSRTENGEYEFLAVMPTELVTSGAKLNLHNGSVESGAKNAPSAAIQILPLPDLEAH